MTKRLLFIFLLLIFLILFSIFIHAQSIGISPSKIELNVSKGIIYTSQFLLHNPSGHNVFYLINSSTHDDFFDFQRNGLIRSDSSRFIILKILVPDDYEKTSLSSDLYITFIDPERKDSLSFSIGSRLSIELNIIDSIDTAVYDKDDGFSLGDLFSYGSQIADRDNDFSDNVSKSLFDPKGLLLTLSLVIIGLILYFVITSMF